MASSFNSSTWVLIWRNRNFLWLCEFDGSLDWSVDWFVSIIGTVPLHSSSALCDDSVWRINSATVRGHDSSNHSSRSVFQTCRDVISKSTGCCVSADKPRLLHYLPTILCSCQWLVTATVFPWHRQICLCVSICRHAGSALSYMLTCWQQNKESKIHRGQRVLAC